MFGHQDDQPADDQAIPQESIDAAMAAPTTDQPAVDPAATGSDWQHPGVPVDAPDGGAAQPIADIISPAGGFPKAPTLPTDAEETAAPLPAAGDHFDAASIPEPSFTPSVPAPADDSNDETTHELIDIKQHALVELAPLIDDLDQPPEERFRTLMMMIQASDDQHLVKAAYEAAHNIEDEKVRAQALLDIVNEINYFTQQPGN